MDRPLDQRAADRHGQVRAARLFSNIVSPPVMFALVGLALALHELPFWRALAWAALYGFIVSLVPILFILFLLRTGRIAELHMSSTRERHLPYLSAIFCAVLAYLLINLANGPALMRCLTLFNIVELVMLAIINVFWLISIHATGITATLMIVGLVFGWTAGFAIVFPFVVAVCAVRLYLKRHTPWQLAAGLALGVATVSSLSLTGCF